MFFLFFFFFYKTQNSKKMNEQNVHVDEIYVVIITKEGDGQCIC